MTVSSLIPDTFHKKYMSTKRQSPYFWWVEGEKRLRLPENKMQRRVKNISRLWKCFPYLPPKGKGNNNMAAGHGGGQGKAGGAGEEKIPR